MILKLLTLILAILVFSKYVFNAKIHEKYIFGVTVLLAFFSNFGNKYSAIEMFDGSSVAFDKEAFENLNRVVNEIAGEGKLTIPGDLIVQGKTEFQDDVKLKNGKIFKFEKQARAKFGVDDSRVGDSATGEIGYYIWGPGLNIVGCKGDQARQLQIWADVNTIGTHTIKAQNMYAHKLDTDTLKGHAWGGNNIRLASTVKSDGNKVNINPTGTISLNNQVMSGDSSWGIRATKFVGDQFVCNGNATRMDKTNGIKTSKLSSNNGKSIILKSSLYGEKWIKTPFLLCQKINYKDRYERHFNTNPDITM